MDDRNYDVIVIGAGSGGLSFSRTAAGLGASVALIERDRLGGTCVNRGCVPKKLMWTLADTIKRSRDLTARGILAAAPEVNMPRFRETSDTHIDGIVDSFADDLSEAGIDLYRGDGRISAEGEVRVGDTTLTAGHIVVATGGHPARPDIPGADLCRVSDDMFTLTELPESILIVGGGYIGCEFASILAGLGVSVTLVSDGDAVLTEFSETLQALARDNLQGQGCTIHLNARPTSVEPAETGYSVTLDGGETLQADEVLLATGRAPNLDVLGALDQAVTLSDGGQIEIDAGFATSSPGLYAIGDCTTRLPLTPVATDDGRILAQQLFGEGGEAVSPEHISTTAFLMPPLAEVGATGFATGDTFAPLSEGVLSSDQQSAWHVALSDGRITGLAFAADGAGEAAGFMAQIVAAGTPQRISNRALAVHPSASEEIFGALEEDQTQKGTN